MTREGQKEEMKETRSERRKIRLTIRGVQSGFGEEEITEITTIADYFHKDGVHYLFYSEITEEGYTVKNRLTVAPDTVELKKTGAGDSFLRFRTGHSEDCRYHSPAGMLLLVSDTKRLEMRRNRNGLALRLEYSFYMSGMRVSDYRLTVDGTYL